MRLQAIRTMPFLRSAALLPVLIFGVLAVALTTGGPPRVEAPGKTTVVYAHPPCPPALVRLYEPIWEEFNATHPDIHLHVLRITRDYERKIKVMFAGNIAPDVIFMYPEALPVWAELGALLPLNELGDKDPEFSVDDYFQVMIRTFTYNGVLFALPKDASADIMQYNVDLFERLGVDPPDESWTWDDFLDAAKRLTIDEDGDGRPEIYGTSGYHWFNWVRQNGGRILSEDGKRCLLDSPEAIEAIQYAADLVYRHHVAPPPAVTMDTSPTILFTQGRIAMHAQMYPVVSILRERCDFMWDLAPLPGPPQSAGPRGKRSVRAVGSGMAITSQCKNPEAAWEWIKWMTGPKGMRGLLSVEMPSCKSLARTEFLRGPTDVPEDDPIRLPLNRQPAVASMTYAELPPQSADYFRMMDIINNGLDPVFRGKAQARDVLPDLVREVNEFLEEGR